LCAFQLRRGRNPWFPGPPLDEGRQGPCHLPPSPFFARVSIATSAESPGTRLRVCPCPVRRGGGGGDRAASCRLLLQVCVVTGRVGHYRSESRARSPARQRCGIATTRGREGTAPAALLLASVLPCHEHASVTSNARGRAWRGSAFRCPETAGEHLPAESMSAPQPRSWSEVPLPGSLLGQTPGLGRP